MSLRDWSTALADTIEWEGDGLLGLKVRLASHADAPTLKQVGEFVATKHRGRAPQVWVFVFGVDMDLTGPAACTSYVADDGEPVTEFTNPGALVLWYQLKAAHRGVEVH